MGYYDVRIDKSIYLFFKLFATHIIYIFNYYYSLLFSRWGIYFSKYFEEVFKETI